jgi:hypothetical protein
MTFTARAITSPLAGVPADGVKELKQSGNPGQALQEATERTYQEMNAVTEAGFSEHEAWEMVRETYLFPPQEPALCAHP